jgi:hypothetical protein
MVYFHSSFLHVKSKIEKQYSNSPSNSSSYSHFATLAFYVKTTVILQKIKKLFPTRVFTRLFYFYFYFFFISSHFARFFSLSSFSLRFFFLHCSKPISSKPRREVENSVMGAWLLRWWWWLAGVLAVVGLVFLRVFWIFWVWVCWSSCGGWVGVPSGVLAWVCSPISARVWCFAPISAWCWSRGCGCGVADLGGLRREARNEEREKKKFK